MLTLDPLSGVLSDGERSLRLTPAEGRLVIALARRRGKLVPYETLMQEMYSRADKQPEDKIITVMACKVRKKAKEAGFPAFIGTNWGRGLYVSDIEVLDSGPIAFTQQQRAALQELIETHPNTRLAERVFSAMAV